MTPPTLFQARLLWWAASGLAAAVLVGLVVGLIWGVGQALSILSPVLWPLAVAGVLAYLLDPVVDFLVSRKIPRPRAITLVFCLAIAVCIGVLGSIVPQVFREAQQFAQRVPTYASSLQQQVDKWIQHPPVILQKALQFLKFAPISSATNGISSVALSTNAIPSDASGAPTSSSEPGGALSPDLIRSITSWFTRAMPATGRWILEQVGRVGSWFGIIAGAFLVPVYLFYFLLEKRGIERRWTEYLPVRKSEFKDELVFCLRAINNYLIVFFRSQVLVALCDGVLYTLGFLVIGLPYAFLLGLMATMLTMIPFLGAIATCVTALLIAFAATGSWQLPALVGVVFTIVQTIEGLVISPKIMGDRVGLHPLAIIVSVMVGTTLLGGVLGGVLAIPLAAALRVILFRYVWTGRQTSGKA